jgi:hypothetical protein
VENRYNRLNRWIDQLQADQAPGLRAADPAEGALFRQAAAWMARRPGAGDPDPAFLARLRAHLCRRENPPA